MRGLSQRFFRRILDQNRSSDRARDSACPQRPTAHNLALGVEQQIAIGKSADTEGLGTTTRPAAARSSCPFGFAPREVGENDSLAPPPPLIPGLPLLGNTLALIRNPEGFLLDAHQKYGPVFRVRLGFEKFTVLTGVQGCTFFKENREAGLTREPFYGRFTQELGTDYFILSEPQGSVKHGGLRRMMKLGFSREVAAAYVPQMVEAVQSAARSWAPGQTIPVMDAMARLTFQLYGFVMADRDLSAMYPDAKRYAQTIMRIGTKLAPPVVLNFPGYRRSKQAVFALMNELFADARRGSLTARPHLTIMGALAQALDAPDSTQTEAEVISSTLYGFVGTMVYMNRAVSFLLYELAKNPATMERATREADAAFAEGMPTAQTLRRMVYLRAALNESLRRHPIAIGLPFCAQQDFVFEGCQIRKGETVLISHVFGHFSQEHYRDPWKFEPERFLEPRNEQRRKGTLFAPFGFGGRVCTAVGLVETMVFATVATLLRTLRFELERPSYQLRVTYSPLPGPESAFRIRIKEHRRPPSVVDSLPPIEEAVGDVLGASGETDLVTDALARLETRSYPANATIYRRGDVAEEFFILIEGEVCVARTDPKSETGEAARWYPGQFFGESELLSGSARIDTVTCSGALPVKVLVMRRDVFVNTVTEADLLSSDIAHLARRRFLAHRLAEALPQLSGREVHEFACEFQLERIAGQALIVRQGDQGETFHIVASGAVEVFREGPEGERFLARLGPGQFFGEMALLMRCPRTATVRAAAEGADVMTMNRDGFNRMISGSRTAKSGVAEQVLQRAAVLLHVGQNEQKAT
jgi:cytochrome P450/CRP-like cAMP-binding protein